MRTGRKNRAIDRALNLWGRADWSLDQSGGLLIKPVALTVRVQIDTCKQMNSCREAKKEEKSRITLKSQI